MVICICVPRGYEDLQERLISELEAERQRAKQAQQRLRGESGEGKGSAPPARALRSQGGAEDAAAEGLAARGRRRLAGSSSSAIATIDPALPEAAVR